MVNGKVWLVLVFCAAAITEARHGSNRANEVDLDQCQVRLYRHQYFRGPLPVITRDRKRLKGLEKSIRTIGDCCWALYPKRNFKGRPMFLGGKIALRSSMKWGWLGQKVRSAKKLKSCTML